MIFESLGGVSAEAERVIKCLNKAVADNTDTPETEVATLFWRRMSIDIQRSAHKAFIRRVGHCVDEGGGANILQAFGGGLLEVAGGI